MRFSRVIPIFLLALCVAVASQVQATVVGVSQPAPSLTAARIAKLPASQRAAWTAYLERSHQQEMRDRAALAAERKGLVSGVNYSFRSTTTIITDSCWNVFVSSPC
jgi:hypothetical protein